MGQTDLINPVNLDKLQPLSKAEKEFVKCMAAPDACKISDHRPGGRRNGDSNVVRADLIRFFAWGGNNEYPIKGNTIALYGAYVEGVLNLTHIPSPHALMLLNCHFSEVVMTSYARFRSLDLGGSLLAHPLIGNGMDVDNDLCLNTNLGVNKGLVKTDFVAERGVYLLGANVGGDLVCDGGTFKSSIVPINKGQAIIADRINVGGNVFLRFGFEAGGEVRLLGANIGSNLYCTGEILKGVKSISLHADGIKVGGNVSLNDGFTTDGEVRLDSANIGGTLDCIKGNFLKQEGRAITATNVVADRVFLRNGFVAKSAVWLLGAKIAGDLDCSGGDLESKDDYALVADNARVGGNLFMGVYEGGARFCANGGVKLCLANIAGNLDCGGGKFIDVGKGAFVADGVEIGRELQMNSPKKGMPFFANGDVRLVAANIGANWTCTGGIFGGNISAESAKIGNSMFWTKVVRGGAAKVYGRGTVSLQGVAADIFDYDEQSRDGFDFILDGFAYRWFAEHKDVQSRIKWLNNRPARKPFSPQPFEHAAKVLFAMGRDNDAREVLLEKDRQTTDSGESDNVFWRRAWDWSARYGYRPTRTLWISLFCLMIGWGVFCAANLSHYIVPHQPVVMADERYRTAVGDDCPSPERPTEVVARLFPEYPKFSAFLYSLDVFIPFFALHQESHWYPLPPKACGNFWAWALWVWYCIEIIAGWVLTSLLVLSLTGLLRPRQSSGGE